MTVRLRPLAPADLDDLEAMERALFGAGAWSRASLAEELDGPGRWYVGAEDAGTGELVGYAGLWFDGWDAQVMTIGTRPDAQGRGVGRVLLDALLGRARELRAGDVLLEVRVDNGPALRLYERAGFERFGRRRGYYQPENVDAWTMRLRLAGSAQPQPGPGPVPGDRAVAGDGAPDDGAARDTAADTAGDDAGGRPTSV